MARRPVTPAGRVAAGLAVAVTALGLAVAVSVPGVDASTLARLLPFGCANPAGHASRSLLPAAPAAAGSGVTCFGTVFTPKTSAGPVGYGPAQLQSAYKIAGKKAGGRTVAVVVAYDNPKAESDLAGYRAAYHLPPCPTANGCFRKVNQNGLARPLPARDYGWAEESSLDLDAMSATCPDCRLLLVEADSPTTGPLMTAVDTAVRLGAVAVSNSYGGVEDGTILGADKHLNHPGVAITAAAGDEGYRAEWPASSPFVTAVGGTTLKRSSTARGWTETVWSGTGSGCSRYEPKPTWQTDSGCKRRTIGDVAADANPATGLGVYDTFNNCLLAVLCDGLIASGAAQGLNGWAQVGGTSLSAPIVAAIYALAGNNARPAYPYAHRAAFFDVRSGSNGACGGSYLCTAKIGYDGPTGLGTPNGLGAF